MKKLIIFIAALSQIIGCSMVDVKIPIDGASLGEDVATAVIYSGSWTDTWPVYLDGRLVGTLDPDTPVIKFPVEPGYHKLWAKGAITLDRRVEGEFREGKVYWYRVYFHSTLFPGFMIQKLERTHEIEELDMRVPASHVKGSELEVTPHVAPPVSWELPTD